eukprot:snap_masked-scaffold19_size710362-processed-gene-4.14 protein:Tk00408 transcript:snap_masked-scaffold19_size710362-processed-gene-4.14-mRNA-1 annotation:"hypothetical protein EAG_12595"
MEDLSHPPETMCLIVEGVSTSDLLRLHESLLAPELREDQWRELEPLVALMGVTGPKLVVQDPVPFLSQPVFVCQVCSKEYSSEKRLVQHEEMHNKVEAGTSTTEETTFGRRPRRASNKPRRFQSSEANGFECPSCEAEFESEAARDLHYREHTRQASSYRKKTRGGHFRFRCGICRKNFASKQSLQNHELLHSGQRDFECDLCEKRFVSLTTLKSHRKLHSEDAQHAFPCKHCEKSFQNPSNLARHVRNLHFEFSDCRIFTCSQCQKTFKDPSGLASHLKTHEAKRDFACPDCDKAFLTAAHLRCHTLVLTFDSRTPEENVRTNFTAQRWAKEVRANAEMAMGFADLTGPFGFRAPFLHNGGNALFQILANSEFTMYDSSLTFPHSRKTWPYHLYNPRRQYYQGCSIKPCPTRTFNLWEVPLGLWKDINENDCQMMDGCNLGSTVEEALSVMMRNFNDYRRDNIPFPLMMHAAVFLNGEREFVKTAFTTFIDTLLAEDNVHFVTIKDLLNFIENPLSNDQEFSNFRAKFCRSLKLTEKLGREKYKDHQKTVVIFCSMLYCLPVLWPAYERHYPYIAPYLLPLVHIALMSSVYCTVVMSWERYIRIVLISNLVNCTYLSRGKFRFYVAMITIFPIIFYLPKFYEVRPQFIGIENTVMVDCNNVTDTHHLPSIMDICQNTTGQFINFTSVNPHLIVEKTWLRQNPIYYQVYCIGINTLFATALPFGLLLYLNISTVMALRRLGKQTTIGSPQHSSEINQVATDTTRVSGEFQSRAGRGRRSVTVDQPKMRRSNSPMCRRRENRLTRISLAIVWAFLFCHIWKIIPTAYEVFVGSIDDGSFWLRDIQEISHMLIVLNSSVNFLIYAAL